MDRQSPEISSTSLVRPFYPALDGLRAIAFLMVFLVHYGTGSLAVPYLSPIFAWGWVGVDLFFVLSGFLITGILYDSLHGKHYFKNFYVRRALRIFPLFYGVWVVALLLTPLLHIEWNRYDVYMAAYIGNFWGGTHAHAVPGLIFFAPRHPGGPPRTLMLVHFWTLCVEEQFYLVWPAVVWLVRSRRKLLSISLALVAVTPVLRMLYAAHHPAQVASGLLYCLTFFRMDTLFLGAALALWLRGTTMATATIRRYASITTVVAPVLLGVGYVITAPHTLQGGDDAYIATYGFTLIAITAAAVVLLAIDPKSLWMRTLQQRPLLFLGRMSYGLYVFHAIPMGFVGGIALYHLQPHHLQFIAPLLAFAGTVGVAWLSFRYFESPFLRLKSVLAPLAKADLMPPASPELSETLRPFRQPAVSTAVRPAA